MLFGMKEEILLTLFVLKRNHLHSIILEHLIITVDYYHPKEKKLVA